jgi:hypothetical protein
MKPLIRDVTMAETFTDLLARFEHELAAVGSPIASNLAPGLDPEEVRARLIIHGMEPGQDLLAWFAWHNGLLDEQTARNELRYALGWEYFSLDRALSDWHWWNKGIELWQWQPTWLPIAWHGGADRMAIDCAPPAGMTSSVRDAAPDAGLFDESQTQSVRGLSTVVQWWIDAITSGRWSYDKRHNSWRYEAPTAYPVERLTTGLV